MYIHISRYLSVPARCTTPLGGQAGRVQLEPTKSTLTAVFCVKPETIKNAKNGQKWVHAKGRRERRFRRFELSPASLTT